MNKGLGKKMQASKFVYMISSTECQMFALVGQTLRQRVGIRSNAVNYQLILVYLSLWAAAHFFSNLRREIYSLTWWGQSKYKGPYS